ncbi:MAG: PAC2 family protein [Nitrososphaera sp.]
MKKQPSNSSTFEPSASESTQILPLPKAKQIALKRPTLIVGFQDSGMVGSLSTNHLVEQLGMHQIAFVESPYVMPAAFFIAGKFRHPFRIYSNKSGTLCVLMCEAPTTAMGTYSIVSAILGWCADEGVKEIMVVGSITPDSYTATLQDVRRALLLESREDGQAGSGGIFGNITHALRRGNADGIALPAAGLQNEPEGDSSVITPNTAVIVGLAGALISSGVNQNLLCRCLLVPTLANIPDPEGAAILLEALGKVIPSVQTDVSALRTQAEAIRKNIEEFVKMRQASLQEYERQHGASGRPGTETIYK